MDENLTLGTKLSPGAGAKLQNRISLGLTERAICQTQSHRYQNNRQ
jgi:hypothetical protein